MNLLTDWLPWSRDQSVNSNHLEPNQNWRSEGCSAAPVRQTPSFSAQLLISFQITITICLGHPAVLRGCFWRCPVASCSTENWTQVGHHTYQASALSLSPGHFCPSLVFLWADSDHSKAHRVGPLCASWGSLGESCPPEGLVKLTCFMYIGMCKYACISPGRP